MRFPESVTSVLLEVDAGAAEGLSVRIPGEAERWGPGDPDLDLTYGPVAELCRSLVGPPAKKPVEFPYTDDIARGLVSL
jgi:hypothetical protein